MSSTCRPLWALLFLAALCTGTGALALKAVAQGAQTIQDDPTIAPDPAQSADNNITFPVDT
jgi:hypothetical protein